ncbi:MAG: membrane protein insertase YidC [Candidatus Saccharimonas sp.]|nr:membrane protein insertase YidC [Planctomycetaceae bacterium]
MLLWFGWLHFLVPKLWPVVPKPRVPAVSSVEVDVPADATAPENAVVADTEQPAVAPLPKHPVKSVWLGPEVDDDKQKLDEFFLAVKFDSRGAAVNTIELTDRARYPAFGRRDKRLRLVGSDIATSLRTFELQAPAIDALLKSETLDRIPWEITAQDKTSITFRLQTSDGRWELVKHFQLEQLTEAELKQPHVRDTLARGYQLRLTVTVKNLSPRPQELSYTLRGPVGVPLEDADNTYKYRDVRMGFFDEDGAGIDESKLSAAEVVKKVKAKKTELSKRPIKYIGVDVLYFAALLIPQEDQLKQRTIDQADCVVVAEDKQYPQYSDVTVDLTSSKLTIPANDEIKHEFVLYAGPKLKELVQQVSAGAVMDYGWFDSICRGMVWLLNMFHAIGLSYGVAILCLTALVRTLLMPLSKHQAKHAAKMKELQPKIAARQKELEAKHGKNTEEYIKASQELVAEQSKMMLGGCLPVFLQLPIFIALYRAIGSSIELRMEPFLWFENLASPDALFALPFKVPFLGWTEFNLLPCISAGLMYVHQKLTMPAPTNEEQAAQQKMMSFMMIMMAAMFYRVPSGLCLYFIATNIWSMTERWLLERKAKADAQNSPPAPPSSPSGPGNPPQPKKPSPFSNWWYSMVEAADKDVSIKKKSLNDDDSNDRKNKKNRGKR